MLKVGYLVVIWNSLYFTVKTGHCSNIHTSGLEECPPYSKCLGAKGCHCDDGYVFVGSNCMKGKDNKLLRCYSSASKINTLFCWSIPNLSYLIFSWQLTKFWKQTLTTVFSQFIWSLQLTWFHIPHNNTQIMISESYIYMYTCTVHYGFV